MSGPATKGDDEARRADAIRAHEAEDRLSATVNEAAIKASELVLRTFVLINGGAAVAILAFVGSLAAKTSTAQLSDTANNLKWFAYGVACAAGGMAFSYVTHYTGVGAINSRLNTWEHPYVLSGPSTKSWVRVNIFVHCLALFAGIASLTFFLIGMAEVRAAIVGLK